MKIVCAWCGKDLGEKDGKGKEGVTHGVCEECLDKVKGEAENGVRVDGENNGNSVL